MIATVALSPLKPAVTSLPSFRASSYSSPSQWRPPPDQNANSRKKNPNPTLFLYHISHQTTSSSRAIASLPSIRASSSSSSSSQSQRPDENSRVAVWWNLGSCPVPEGFDPARVPQAIEAAVRANGINGPVHITAVADLFKAEHSNFSWKTLSDAGVTISYAHLGWWRSMERHLSIWAGQNPPPSLLFLITNWCWNDILKGGRIPDPPFYSSKDITQGRNWYFHDSCFTEDLYSPVHKTHDKWRVVVWWDFDSVPITDQVNESQIWKSILAVVKPCGMDGCIEMHCFGDAIQLSEYPCAALMSQKIDVTVTHVPNGGKQSAGECLLAGLKRWTSVNPPPVHLVLITSDPGYASTLRELRARNYNTLVVGDEVPGVLCKEASMVWSWNDSLEQEVQQGWENLVPRYFNQPPDASLYGHYDVALEEV